MTHLQDSSDEDGNTNENVRDETRHPLLSETDENTDEVKEFEEKSVDRRNDSA